MSFRAISGSLGDFIIPTEVDGISSRFFRLGAHRHRI